MPTYHNTISCRAEDSETIYEEYKGDYVQLLKSENGINMFDIVHATTDKNSLMIMMYSVEDVGNHDYFLCNGMRKLGHRVMSTRQGNNEHDYPAHISIADMSEKILHEQAFMSAQGWLDTADVVQIEDTWGIPPIAGHTRLALNREMLCDFAEFKKLILYHKGTTYRRNHQLIHATIPHEFKCEVIHFVSTPDLLQCHPDNIWMPNVIDMDYILDRWPRAPIDDDQTRIIFPYTDLNNFGEAAVFKAIEELKAEGYPILFHAVRNMPWPTCLTVMAKCDIHIGKIINNLPNPYGDDKIFLPYGVGAIEAGAYKIPTITSVPKEHERSDSEPDETKNIPLVNARPDTVKEKLRHLIENVNYRKKLGNDMYNYTKWLHDITPVCKRYNKIIKGLW